MELTEVCCKGSRSFGPACALLIIACILNVSCQHWMSPGSNGPSPHVERTDQIVFEGWASAVAFAQKGTVLAIGGCLDPDSDGDAPCSHGLVEMWSLKEPRERSAFKFPREVTTLAVSPDGNQWVAGGSDGRLMVSTLSSKSTTKLTHQKNKITALAFSPDGKWVASGSLDPSFPLGFMDPSTGGMIRIKTAFEPVTALAFSPNGKDLAVGTVKGQLFLWNYVGRTMPTFIGSGTTRDGHAVTGIAFSPDGQLLAYGRENGSVVILDQTTGQELMTFKAGASINSITFSPDNRHLAIAQENGQILILEPHSRHPVWSKRHVVPVSALAYSPDGASLGVATQRYIYLYKINGKVSSLVPADHFESSVKP